MEFKRKIFITGGSSGLSSEIIKESKNRNIEIHYHQRINNNTNPICGDIREEEVQDNILKFIIDNDINVFINNAAIYSNKSLDQITISDIDDIISINLTSKIILTKKILDHFKRKGYGMIYNINSLAGIKGSKNESLYSATKHGLKGFTDSLKEEFKNFKNIRITNVTLGAFKSKITKDRDNYEDLAEPNEVANCIIDHIIQDYKTINNDLIITRK